MGEIITTQNLVAIKEVRHAGQQAGVSARARPLGFIYNMYFTVP